MKIPLSIGNRNRHGIPLDKEVKQLICISKKIYERLKEEVKEVFKSKKEKKKDIQRDAPASEKNT